MTFTTGLRILAAVFFLLHLAWVVTALVLDQPTSQDALILGILCSIWAEVRDEP